MNIQFTGAMTKNIELFDTILDGEHILHNKKGEFINLFAAFDIYIINNKNVRSNAFIPPSDEMNIVYNKYRLPTLVNVVNNLNSISVVNEGLSPIRIEHKNFKADNMNQSIFQCCATILNNQDSLEYTVDGFDFYSSIIWCGSFTTR